jgi:cellulose synthase/poly-beta-1,6-N-acetylglucosamine synthase-like glycosyltransferase
VAIPAHDEGAVIGRTVATLKLMDYPPDLFAIAVVADHCSDSTAEVARRAGAQVYERTAGARGGKGDALRWLFEKTLAPPAGGGRAYDAVVVFDADTLPSPDFLRVMDARLSQGDVAIQGQHRISNPGDGWFPGLTWAMFIVDNRLQNQGRSNLGWSAKNMGDSICFRADVLRRFGWGDGLTDDYAFRQQLLLEGIRIRYEPAAIGCGEAALTWQVARPQRERWLRGARDARRRYAGALVKQALRRLDPALMDGALQAFLPSYSTLAVFTLAVWVVHEVFDLLGHPVFVTAWQLLLVSLVAYPLWGLALERAPARAYFYILSGPCFIVWRTWLALRAALARPSAHWVRTPRKAP